MLGVGDRLGLVWVFLGDGYSVIKRVIWELFGELWVCRIGIFLG